MDRYSVEKAGPVVPAPPPVPAAPAGPPPEMSREPGYLDRVVSGLTFGLSDEASALGGAAGRLLRSTVGSPMGPLPGGNDTSPMQSWDAPAAAVLAEQEAGRQATGGLGTAAEIAGGLMAPVPGLGRATTLAGGIGRGAGSAALGGALQGAGSGEGWQDRFARAAVGGAVGGAIGGVVAPAGELMYKAVTARSPKAAGASARGLLERALQHDQTTPGDAAQAIAAANAEGQTGIGVPHVAGEGVRGLAEDVVNSPNPAQTTLKSAIQARQMDQGQRLTDEATRLGGFTGQTYQGTLKDILDRRATAAAPAFAKAYQFDTASSPDAIDAFTELMDTAAGPKAFARAREIAQDTAPGFKPPRVSDLYDDQGNLVAMPNMEFMHYLKMGVDDLYSSAARGGDSSMGRVRARAIAGVGDRFRSALGQANPDYATALHGYAGESAMKDALEAGREAWGKPYDEFQLSHDGLSSAAEKEMFRLGALSRMTNELSRKRQGPTADIAANLSLVPDVRQKMGVVLADPGAQAAWQRLLELEARQSQLAARTGGSPTSRRMEQSAEVGGDALIGQATQAAMGRGGLTVPDLVMSVLRPVGRGLDAYAKSERRGQLGGMLGLTDRDAVRMLQEMALRPSPPPWASPALSPRLTSGLGAGAFGAVPPTPPTAGRSGPPWYPPGRQRR
jgi:hypothetical protein